MDKKHKKKPSSFDGNPNRSPGPTRKGMGNSLYGSSRNALGYEDGPLTWESDHLKSHATAGYMKIKNKTKWFALQAERLVWFNKKGDGNVKGFIILKNIVKVTHAFVPKEDPNEKNEVKQAKQERFGIEINSTSENGKSYETILECENQEESRHWHDIMKWATNGFLNDNIDETMPPPEISAPHPFSGWLQRKTVNGWKNRHFVVLAHQIKWYPTEEMKREDTMGHISLLSITGVYDGCSEGKVNSAIADMGIPKSKLDCAFFVDRSTSVQPLCLLAYSRQVKEIWLDALKRLHNYLQGMDNHFEDHSDMDNDDAEEELIITKARLETLVSFVPQIVVKRFMRDSTPLTDPETEKFPNGAVLFADISGFTSLAERLAKKGTGGEGAEILCRHINAYFGQIVQLVGDYGGDVIKYAGDALLAMWSTGPSWLTAMSATSCALDIQNYTGQYSADGVTLTLHVGIAAGTITGLHLGGVNNRWEYLIGGQPMLELAAAEGAAKSGEVVLTGRTWGLVSEHCEAKQIGTENLWKLESIVTKTPAAKNTIVEPAISIQPALRPYIPWTIRKRIDLGLGEWMAELRRVTVVFAQLINVTFKGRSKEEADLLQQSFIRMQSAIYDHDGIIRQFIIDDKGSVLVAAFYQHEDDPVRALKASLKILKNLKEIDVGSCIGVTTGKVFLGAVGSSKRREFAMVGDTVNLSARLMCVANNCVLCDNYSYQAAKEIPNTYLKFESLNSIKVKGKSNLIPIFQATLESVPTSIQKRGAGESNSKPKVLFGREREMEVIFKSMKEYKEGTQTFVIEGEEGLGKSLLLNSIRTYLQTAEVEKEFVMFDVFGDSVQSFHSFNSWRQCILLQVLEYNAPATNTDAENEKYIKDLLLSKLDAENVKYAHLLNELLQIDIPENESTSELESTDKISKTASLLASLLIAAAKKRRIAVVIDDGHVVDGPSYHLLYHLKDLVASLVIVIACRTTLTMPPDFNILLNNTETNRMKLGPLSVNDTERVLLQSLDIKELPKQIVALIHMKTSGNPYFSYLLAVSLKENETIKILPNGKCELSSKIKTTKDIQFPDSLENLVISRIGRLSSKDQFVLKVASVIGLQFEFRLLVMIYPVPDDKHSIQDCIAQLHKLDFIVPIPYQTHATYRFTQTVVKECCYNLLLFQQRRLLHAAIAEWYKEYVEDLRPHNYSLGYHYEMAEENQKSSIHYELAADEALSQYNLKKSATFYQLALKNFELAHNSETGEYKWKHNVIKARMRNGLAESYYRLGIFKLSIHHYELALKAIGQPIPKNKSVVHDVGRGFKDAFRKKTSASTKMDDQEALQSIRAYETLVLIFYNEGDRIRMMNCGIHVLHLATAMGFKAEMARAHGSLAVASRVMGDDANASKHVLKAMELSSEVPHLLTFANVLHLCSLSEVMCGVLSVNSLNSVLEMYARICEWRKYCEAMELMALEQYLSADFTQCIKYGKDLIDCGEKHGDKIAIVAGHIAEGRAYIALNNMSAALKTLQEGEIILTSDKENRLNSSFIEINGFLAHVHARIENYDASEHKIIAVMSHIELPEHTFSLFLVYCDMLETCFKLWLDPNGYSSASEKERNTFKDYLVRLCTILQNMSKLYPVVAPRSLMKRGQIEWMLGNSKKARKFWDEALSAAEYLGLPYETALTIFEIGTLAEDDQEREGLFVKAVNEFDRLGIPHPPLLVNLEEDSGKNAERKRSQKAK